MEGTVPAAHRRPRATRDRPAARPAEAAPKNAPAAPQEHEALLAWSAESTELLLSAWPYEAATVDYHAAEVRSWRLSLSADGARATHIPAPAAGEDPAPATVSARGTAGELVLVLYARIPVDSLKIDGDRRVLYLLQAWEPEE